MMDLDELLRREPTTVQGRFDELMEVIQKYYVPSREKFLAIRKIGEAALWLSQADLEGEKYDG